MTIQNKSTGRGSNLSQEDRIKGGEHSHKSPGSKSQGTNLSQSDRKKGGKTSSTR